MLSKNQINKQSFVTSLKLLLAVCKKTHKVPLQRIFKILSGKGYAALFILFSFPFCLPLQIPGFSTPFGIILAFLGLRFACGQHLWWPKWILKKEISAKILEKVLKAGIKIFQFINKALKPRALILTKSLFFHRLHGFVIFILSLFLLLPLPIPLTNLLSAAPITLIGLGLLKDDGLVIILGYTVALLCLSGFIGLFLL